MKRTGMYQWAGPGTIRMIKLKYFDAPIDEAQLLRAYERDSLKQFRDRLGVTDAWVTYSWGFGDETEREDREFLRRALPAFQALGIKAHAYVQGTNLVRNEHPYDDLYCRDAAGSFIPYHRGRLLCCPNSPRFRELLLRRVRDACREEAGGVFIDNFHSGQFPVALGHHATFFGCACAACAASFKARTGAKIPRHHDLRSALSREYVAFRCETMLALAEEIKKVATAHGKEFGSNSFDQTLDSRLFYGYDIRALREIQDYVLLENFNHPSIGGSNAGHADLFASPKPVFVVSYKRVIGKHAESEQADIDAVFTESEQLGYNPCYKASEFTTDGTWHNLDPWKLRRPQRIALPKRTAAGKMRSVPLPGLATRVAGTLSKPFLRFVYEYETGRKTLGWILDLLTSRHVPMQPEEL